MTQIYNLIKHTFSNNFFDDFFDNFIDHFFDHIFDNLGSQIWFQNSQLGLLWLATNWGWNQNENNYSNTLTGKNHNFHIIPENNLSELCKQILLILPLFWVVGNIKITTYYILKRVCMNFSLIERVPTVGDTEIYNFKCIMES